VIIDSGFVTIGDPCGNSDNRIFTIPNFDRVPFIDETDEDGESDESDED
jgi:hypothetical protein